MKSPHTFTRDEIRDAKLLEDKIFGQSRWSTFFERVIEVDSQAWIGLVDEPSTEIQDGGYENDVIFYPAVQITKVITVWEREQ